MKKIMFVVAAFFALTFASCGNKTASDAEVVDTVSVDTVITDSVAADTVAAE